MKFYVLFEIDTKKKKLDLIGVKDEKHKTNANQLSLDVFLPAAEFKLTFLYWLAEHDITGAEAGDIYKGILVGLLKIFPPRS